jgi:hypothetical protein
MEKDKLIEKIDKTRARIFEITELALKVDMVPVATLNEVLDICIDILGEVKQIAMTDMSIKDQKNVNTRIVSGCLDCQLCDPSSHFPEYCCLLGEHTDNFIKESDKLEPITPTWCPIKQSNFLFQYSDQQIVLNEKNPV